MDSAFFSMDAGSSRMRSPSSPDLVHSVFSHQLQQHQQHQQHTHRMQHLSADPERFSSAASSATVCSPPLSPCAPTLVLEASLDQLPKAFAAAADSPMMLETDVFDFDEPQFDGFSDEEIDDEYAAYGDENDVSSDGRARSMSPVGGDAQRPDATVERLRQRQLRRVSVWRSDVALSARSGPSDAVQDQDARAHTPFQSPSRKRTRTEASGATLVDGCPPSKRPRTGRSHTHPDHARQSSQRPSPLSYPMAQDMDHVMQEHDSAY